MLKLLIFYRIFSGSMVDITSKNGERCEYFPRCSLSNVHCTFGDKLTPLPESEKVLNHIYPATGCATRDVREATDLERVLEGMCNRLGGTTESPELYGKRLERYKKLTGNDFQLK